MSYRKTHITPKIRKLKSRKPFFKSLVFWIALGVVVTFFAGAYFLLWYPGVQVALVSVEGTDHISSDQISAVVFSGAQKTLVQIGPLHLTTRSLLLVNKKALAAELLGSFSLLSQVEVTQELPNRLFVNVKERQGVAVFCNAQENCSSIDQDGVIFENLQQIPPGIIVLSGSGDGAKLGEQVVDPTTMHLVLSLAKNLWEVFGVKVAKVEIADPLVTTTSEGWKIYLDPSADANLQINKLSVLLKSQIPTEDRRKLHYIYLQYQDRVFYQ